MITDAQAAEMRARYARYQQWAAQYVKPNGWTIIPAEAQPPVGDEWSNADSSTLEVYEFMHDKPQRYFLYIAEKTKLATTWTGDKLGDVEFGASYRDNFGG